MTEILSKYIPTNAVIQVVSILNQHPISIKITKDRKTKHGDFKVLPNGKKQISINHNLNKYQFLITLIHEIAHFTTFKKYRKVKPHGLEWKMEFQQLMLPFLRPEVFPNSMLPVLAKHFKNPKASTSSDINLSLALKQFDKNSGKNFIFEIATGSIFEFNNKFYKKGNKRRVRFECVELKSAKTYLFNPNAEITLVNKNEK